MFAHGGIERELVQHEKGAECLRLKLLSVEMMMFCLQYSRSTFATMIPDAVTSGDDIEIPTDVYYDL